MLKGAFSDFWRINIGHVIVIISVILTWGKDHWTIEKHEQLIKNIIESHKEFVTREVFQSYITSHKEWGTEIINELRTGQKEIREELKGIRELLMNGKK